MAAWAVVVLVGVFVVALVAGITLIPRLHAAQRLLWRGTPVFTNERVAGDAAGVTMISHAVDTLTPIVTPQGGASSEVPQLVAFVSKQTGLSQSQVLGALQKNFPHTTALLEAIPLSAVNSEIPKLVGFLATTLHLSDAQVLSALQKNFPDLYQSIVNLPYVVNGWYNVPGTANYTTFTGVPISTVPQVRDYFQKDVIPLVASQQSHFNNLATRSGVGYIAPLLLTLGIIVIIFGVVFALFAGHESRDGRIPKTLHVAAWSVVTAVGAAIIVAVFALNLFSRLDGGQNLLDNAKPLFSQSAVAGDQAAMTMVGHVVDFAEPAVNTQGGASSEVPQLVAFVSKETGLSQKQVLSALQTNFPHVTALLEAIPLSSVTSEIPGLVSFLGTTLHMSNTQVLGALSKNFPALAQAVTNLPYVTNGWENIPGTANLTDFNGAPVHSVPQMANYLAGEVIPFIAQERGDYNTVVASWPRVTWFPPLLLVVGIIVLIYGLLMVVLSSKFPLDKAEAPAPPPSVPAGV